MKKVIIGIFCSLICATSYADGPSISNYANKWLDGYTGAYSTSLNTDAGTGYSLLSSQISNGKGVIIYAARNIYEHGANICEVQIGTTTKEIEYYWKDSWPECVKLCEPGYSGIDCKDHDVQASCPSDYVLNSISALLVENLNNFKHTKDMEILDSVSSGTTNVKQEDIVLGVVKRLDHGALVSPVKITALAYNADTTLTTLTSVLSNNHTTLLCQEGYVADGDKCVTTNDCKINMDKMCEGFSKSDYDATSHVLKTKKLSNSDCQKTNNGNLKVCKTIGETCTYFECRDGYGFKESGSKKCIECNGSLKQGITIDGMCKICDSGDIFNKSTKSCTRASDIIAREQMRGNNSGTTQCWTLTDPDKYKTCVIGE